eukprot:Sspe_Gene.42509::Locus_20634_Transcript_1_1_Confidence_1.000_Length_1935::g.42509::m.42509
MRMVRSAVRCGGSERAAARASRVRRKASLATTTSGLSASETAISTSRAPAQSPRTRHPPTWRSLRAMQEKRCGPKKLTNPRVETASTHEATLSSPLQPRRRISNEFPPRHPVCIGLVRTSKLLTFKRSCSKDRSSSTRSPRTLHRCVVTAFLSFIPAHTMSRSPHPMWLLSMRTASNHPVLILVSVKCVYGSSSPSSLARFFPPRARRLHTTFPSATEHMSDGRHFRDASWKRFLAALSHPSWYIKVSTRPSSAASSSSEYRIRSSAPCTPKASHIASNAVSRQIADSRAPSPLSATQVVRDGNARRVKRCSFLRRSLSSTTPSTTLSPSGFSARLRTFSTTSSPSSSVSPLTPSSALSTTGFPPTPPPCKAADMFRRAATCRLSSAFLASSNLSAKGGMGGLTSSPVATCAPSGPISVTTKSSGVLLNSPVKPFTSEATYWSIQYTAAPRHSSIPSRTISVRSCSSIPTPFPHQ